MYDSLLSGLGRECTSARECAVHVPPARSPLSSSATSFECRGDWCQMSAATYGSAVMEEAHSLLGASDTVDDEAFIQRRRARTIKGFLSYSMSSEVSAVM